MSGVETIEFIGAEGNYLVGDLHRASAPAERAALRGPALLLHGGGQTRHAWEETATRLAAHGLDAIVLDQRGHGASAWSKNGHYAFEDFAADVIQVADAITGRFGRRPIAVGASLGGIAALMAEGEVGRPLFDGLVLVDITQRMDADGVARIVGFMRARVQEGFATVEEAADAVAAYLPHRPRPKSLDGLKKNLRLSPDGRWRWHWDPRFMDGPRAVDTDGHLLTDRLSAAARRLAIPTLLVRGQRSELISKEHVEEFMRLVPHARTVDVRGAGHMVAGDRNDVFATAVIEFLEEQGVF
ncbi:alpha/beta fold hydrolase [Methyloraptor flagellatus]|uniref:Alpha/beta hydrolase n=1 Tax=Methyloraptor flagellatus TaxID=3162530 RepID=A0AAU7XCK3_9HYPH